MNGMMMNTSLTPPIIGFTPMMRPLNPGHDIPEIVDPPVLDLCVRKRPVSPNYPHDYTATYTPFKLDPPIRISTPQSQSGCSEISEVSSSEMRDINANCQSTKIKPTRPFKAYPKDPMSLALIGTTTDILGKDSAEAYTEFRQKMISYAKTSHTTTNKNMRRTQSQNPQQVTDPTYWEKRKKNNEAAKRSRDARRAKEDEIAIRCAFLEQENVQLKFRLAALESEKDRLQSMIYG